MAVAVAKRRQARGLGNERTREALVGYGFIALPMAFFLLFFIVPVGYAVYISRYDWQIFKGPYVGFGNYRHLYHDTVSELTGLPGPEVVEKKILEVTGQQAEPWAIICSRSRRSVGSPPRKCTSSRPRARASSSRERIRSSGRSRWSYSPAPWC